MCQTPGASLLHRRQPYVPMPWRGSPLCSASLLEHLDLALALDARRVIGRQWLDQAPDPVTGLEREVGGRGPGERADVLDRRLMAGGEAGGVLVFAQGFFGVVGVVGAISSSVCALGTLADGVSELPPILVSSVRSSISACWAPEIALVSPISHAWL